MADERNHPSNTSEGRSQGRSLRDIRWMPVFQIVVGLVLLVFFQGYVIWKVVPAPWVGVFLMAVGALSLVFPHRLNQG